jgi:hypothetical protein
MKKIMITLAITFSTIGAFAGEEKVAPKVLDAFNTEFSTAKEVEWTVASDYYMATFTYNDGHVFAYYNTDGDLLGLTRYISINALSMNLQSSLKKNYSDFWVSDLFEVAKNGGTDYYITLENADKKIVLLADSGKDWEVFKKVRKA